MTDPLSVIKFVYDLINAVLLFCAAQMASATVQAYPEPYVVDYGFAIFTMVAAYLSIAVAVTYIVVLCVMWTRR